MIDIVLLTKNSEYVLEQCLDSLYRNVPVKRLIVVDGGSQDNTLKILRKYPNVEIVDDKPTCRGIARQIGMEKAETDWFMFIDSDVVLCQNWYNNILNENDFTQEDTGAICAVDIPCGVEVNTFTGKLFKSIEQKVFEMRGSCHDILIRKRAVGDIKIPSSLHTLEDLYIKKWIVSKGYKFVIDQTSFCIHYKTMKSLFSRSNISSTIDEFKNNQLLGPIENVKRILYATLYALFWALYEIKKR